MKTTKVYKYPQKSFISYFLFFEICVLLGTVPLFFTLSSEQIEYKIGFLTAIPIATFLVYIVLKTNIRAQNAVSVELKDSGIVYKDISGHYEMSFEKITKIDIERIEKLFHHKHKIITLGDGSKKVDFANYITDNPPCVGITSGFRRLDTTSGDELLNLILEKSKYAAVQGTGRPH